MVHAAIPEKSQKYGIEVPTMIKRALEIDKETETDYWQKAIAKEMVHILPTFKFLLCSQSAPIGSKWIPCHMVSNTKIDYRQQVCFVAGGHVTDLPTSIMYSSFIAQDSVELAFLFASLNDLDILSADIGNAYLNAPTR
jgi:hypothetical protein